MGKIGAKRLEREQQCIRNYALQKSIGKNLQSIRQELGFTFKEAAKGTGLAESKICEWEQGGTPIPLHAIQELAVFYGVSIDWLFGNCDDPNEQRTQVEIVRYMHDLAAKQAEEFAILISMQVSGSSMVRGDALALIEKTSQFLQNLHRWIALNRELFENEFRGGQALLTQSEDIEEKINALKKTLERSKIMYDPDLRSRLTNIQDVSGFTLTSKSRSYHDSSTVRNKVYKTQEQFSTMDLFEHA